MLEDPLQGETVGETAYRRIRTDIVFGRLVPGEKLKLDRIS
jgi:DNA-binding GntR family transcriptional regulator